MNTLTGMVNCMGCAYLNFDKNKIIIGDWVCLHGHCRRSMGENINCKDYKSIGEKWAEDLMNRLKEKENDDINL